MATPDTPPAATSTSEDDRHLRQLIDRLFPFHILISAAEPYRITSAGASLQRWLPAELVGHRFDRRFAVNRPRDVTVDQLAVALLANEVLLIEDLQDGRILRGQLVPVGGHSMAFIGSPQVTESSRLDELGLSIADFAPHDATVDSMIFAQFATIQVRDAEAKQMALQQISAARNQFSEWTNVDELTGLANRRTFWEQSERARAATNEPIQVLFVDIDGFKELNDEFGHRHGDAVLRTIATRMRNTLRSGDIVARVGADEFVMLVRGVAASEATSVAARLRRELTCPIESSAGMIAPTISIGISELKPGADVDEVVGDADTAMHRGRRQGRGRITWFEDTMGTERRDRRTLTGELRIALDSGEIQPYFQPIVDLRTGRIVSFEALARWPHATRGMVRPDVFVAVAEHAGLIEELDGAIMQQAIAEAAVWTHSLRAPIGLQVNVSGRSLQRELPGQIRDSLRHHRLTAERLTIEVTESWLIEDDHTEVLTAIADMGVELHLDDFGTGFSSLAHLQSFPIGGLKIDRAFVAQMGTSTRSRRLVEATISMARSLQLDVVAEGVETADDAAMLRGFGCDLAQGFLYSPAVPPSEAIEHIERSISGSTVDDLAG